MAASLEDAHAQAAGRGGAGGSGGRQAGVSGPSTPFGLDYDFGYDDEGVAADEDMDWAADEDDDDENEAPYTPRRASKRPLSQQREVQYGKKGIAKKNTRCRLGDSASGNRQKGRGRASTSSSNDDDDEAWNVKNSRGRSCSQAGPSSIRHGRSPAGSPPPVDHGLRRSGRQRTAAQPRGSLPSAIVASANKFPLSFPALERRPSPPRPYRPDMLSNQKRTNQRKALDVFANGTAANAPTTSGNGGGGRGRGGSPSSSRQARGSSTRPTRATGMSPRATSFNAPRHGDMPIVIEDDDDDDHHQPAASSSSSPSLPRSLFDLMGLQRQHARASGRKLERNTRAKKVASANAVRIIRRWASGLQVSALFSFIDSSALLPILLSTSGGRLAGCTCV